MLWCHWLWCTAVLDLIAKHLKFEIILIWSIGFWKYSKQTGWVYLCQLIESHSIAAKHGWLSFPFTSSCCTQTHALIHTWTSAFFLPFPAWIPSFQMRKRMDKKIHTHFDSCSFQSESYLSLCLICGCGTLIIVLFLFDSLIQWQKKCFWANKAYTIS